MKKRLVIGSVAAGLILIGAISHPGNNENTGTHSAQTNNSTPAVKESIPKLPTCDGKDVTTSCVLKGVKYTKYVYHPKVAEKSHTETTIM